MYTVQHKYRHPLTSQNNITINITINHLQHANYRISINCTVDYGRRLLPLCPHLSLDFQIHYTKFIYTFIIHLRPTSSF